MVGTVYRQNMGIVAVHTGEDRYSVFQMSGDAQPGYNDSIEWDPDDYCGQMTVRNLTRNESYVVIMQDHDVTKDDVPAKLLKKR